jgi:hypothetical protein
MNMKKVIFILFVVILVVSGIYFLQSYQENEPLGDGAVVLESIKKNTELDFSEITGVAFKWNVFDNGGNLDKKIVSGYGYGAESVVIDKYENLTRFFRDNGFQLDLANISSGEFLSSDGYKKDNMVCIFSSMPAKIRISGKITYDLEIKCGEL